MSLTIRHYEPSDYPLLESWWQSHGGEPLPESMIPPSSCLVMLDGEPSAFGAVFLCNSNHVGFMHGMCTRPGLSMSEAKSALRALQDGIDIIMRSSGHCLLLGTVGSPAMIKGAKWMGFEVGTKQFVQVNRLVRPLPTEILEARNLTKMKGI
jgi:hypothetical protein